VPRRSRGHVYRKRTPLASTPLETPSTAGEAAPEGEPEEAALTPAANGDGVAVITAPATYRQRIGRAPVTARVGPATPQRGSRALITDYGYVVGEMKRIGLTFGGLIVLLIIISRFLH